MGNKNKSSKWKINKHTLLSQGLVTKCLLSVLDAGKLKGKSQVTQFMLLSRLDINVLTKLVIMEMKKKLVKELLKQLLMDLLKEKTSGLHQNFGTLIIEKSMLKMPVEDLLLT